MLPIAHRRPAEQTNKSGSSRLALSAGRAAWASLITIQCGGGGGQTTNDRRCHILLVGRRQVRAVRSINQRILNGPQFTIHANLSLLLLSSLFVVSSFVTAAETEAETETELRLTDFTAGRPTLNMVASKSVSQSAGWCCRCRKERQFICINLASQAKCD